MNNLLDEYNLVSLPWIFSPAQWQLDFVIPCHLGAEALQPFLPGVFWSVFRWKGCGCRTGRWKVGLFSCHPVPLPPGHGVSGEWRYIMAISGQHVPLFPRGQAGENQGARSSVEMWPCAEECESWTQRRVKGNDFKGGLTALRSIAESQCSFSGTV